MIITLLFLITLGSRMFSITSLSIALRKGSLVRRNRLGYKAKRRILRKKELLIIIKVDRSIRRLI
jgi:hypothetical protein